jgi:hypothetical protein
MSILSRAQRLRGPACLPNAGVSMKRVWYWEKAAIDQGVAVTPNGAGSNAGIRLNEWTVVSAV